MFLNTRGKDKVSNEMKAFLDFVMGRECDDPFIQKLNRRMELAKHNGKWRQEYMIASIRETDLRYEGFTEGDYSRQLKAARNMIARGYDEDEIHTLLELPIDEIRRLK